jgi:hypothetical protein
VRYAWGEGTSQNPLCRQFFTTSLLAFDPDRYCRTTSTEHLA